MPRLNLSHWTAITDAEQLLHIICTSDYEANSKSRRASRSFDDTGDRDSHRSKLADEGILVELIFYEHHMDSGIDGICRSMSFSQQCQRQTFLIALLQVLLPRVRPKPAYS